MSDILDTRNVDQPRDLAFRNKNVDQPRDLEFINKVGKHEALIGVIGLGYVGLPLALGFLGAGFPVIGVDIDPNKVSVLADGKSYIGHVSDHNIKRARETGRFRVESDVSALRSADAIIICVPTPLTANREPDLSYVRSTAKSIGPHVCPGHLIILESTTYPGTTREILCPILEESSGLIANSDFFVAFSPEREDPGNTTYSTATIPKVVGADDRRALSMSMALYGAVVQKVVHVSSTDTAEAVKLTENIFRAVNIALVNELKVIFTEMNVDIWDVIRAAKSKPFGYMPFYPGPGLGGHCIPIDPFYLSWKAREFELGSRFIELAGEINQNMPAYVVGNLVNALSKASRKAMNGARILSVGMAYKKNIGDIRGSPALALMRILKKLGAEVGYFDPYIPEIPMNRDYPEYAGMKSIDWNANQIGAFDAALLVTDHDSVDWKLLVDHSKLVVDTRNCLEEFVVSHGHKIFKS